MFCSPCPPASGRCSLSTCLHRCVTGPRGQAACAPSSPCLLLSLGIQVPDGHSSLSSFFSWRTQIFILYLCHQTTSNNVQSIIESRVEKRTKGVYVPAGGKSMITFMDDLNMPAKDTFGSQPPLELIRLWIDYGFWYDRTKQTIKYIRVSIQGICSLFPPMINSVPPPVGGLDRIV